MSAVLAERIARLERAARRDRVLAIGALVFVLATAQSPASIPLVVRDAGGGTATLAATGLVFRDGARLPRTGFGLDKDRYPSLDLYDASGAMRESMYLLRDRPVLRQFDKAGKRRAELFLADTQNGEFVIRDASDVTRAAAFVGNAGLPEAAFYGSDGKVRAYVASDDNAPYLVMKDQAGTARVVLGSYETGRIGMDVRNVAGTVVYSKP